MILWLSAERAKLKFAQKREVFIPLPKCTLGFNKLY
jgi:hypothetical protein